MVDFSIPEGEKQIAACFFADTTSVTREAIILAYIDGINYAIKCMNSAKQKDN